MILYWHHTIDDLIDLDDQTGTAHPLPPEQADALHAGGLPIAFRADAKVRGSYTIEDGRRCCLYWTDDPVLVLRTPDQRRIDLFRRGADRLLVELMPGASISIIADGDLATFSLRDAKGTSLFDFTYEAQPYRTLFGVGSMIAFTPDDTLADWDFFVATQIAFDELTMVARACALLAGASSSAADTGPTMARSGSPCPRAGLWVACRHLDTWRNVAADETLPGIDGQPEDWVWMND